MTLSLRTQLLLWLGIAVCLVAFVVTFLTQEVMVLQMEKALEDALQRRAHVIASIVSSDITTDEASYFEVINELTRQKFTFIPLMLRLISPSGKIIIEFGELDEATMRELDYKWQLPDSLNEHYDTISGKGSETLRVYAMSIPDSRTGQPLAFVQAAESLSQIEEARRGLWQNAIVAGLAGGLLSLVAGFLLIRRGFRPLRSILKTLDAVCYDNIKAQMRGEARPAEFEQLAKGLAGMWQRLDTAISDREGFFRSVSHDLRTPLAILQGHIELLRRQPSLTEEAKNSLQHMSNEARRLTRLINNLLLNVQLASKPSLANEEVSLRELLDEIVGDVWIIAEGLQLNVTAINDVKVYGDHDLLKQMLLNIVDNAIKFTSKGGTISLTLTSEDGWAIVEVSDTGRGIPREYLPHITEAFYTSKASRRPIIEGVGLGLSIVKQITELHGGQLEIQSQEGGGTSVIVRLPQRVMIVLPER